MFDKEYRKLTTTFSVFTANKQHAINIFLLLIIILVGLTTCCLSNNQTPGEDLYYQALNLEKQKSFSQAANLYEQALSMLMEEKNMELATECSEALQRLMIFHIVYPYTIEQFDSKLIPRPLQNK